VRVLVLLAETGWKKAPFIDTFSDLALNFLIKTLYGFWRGKSEALDAGR